MNLLILFPYIIQSFTHLLIRPKFQLEKEKRLIKLPKIRTKIQGNKRNLATIDKLQFPEKESSFGTLWPARKRRGKREGLWLGRLRIKLGESSAPVETVTPKPKHLLGEIQDFVSGFWKIKRNPPKPTCWFRIGWKFKFADLRIEGAKLCSWRLSLFLNLREERSHKSRESFSFYGLIDIQGGERERERS